MGCCYSEPDVGLSQATVYHEIKPTIIPTYTNTIRNPSVRLPPVAEEILVGYSPTPQLPPTPRPSPILRAEESFRKPDSDLQSLITPVQVKAQAQVHVQPLKKKKAKK